MTLNGKIPLLSTTPPELADLLSWAPNLGPSWEIATKATGSGVGASGRTPSSPIGEGQPGSLLPPTLLPYAFELRYEPDRIFAAFNGAEAESQSIS